MAPLLIIFIVLAIIAAAALAISGHRKTIAQWTMAAGQMGLDLTGGGTFSYPRMNGRIDGFQVSVFTFNSGSGDNQKRYTRYEVGFPPLGLGLELSRQTKVGGFFRRMVGLQDVEIGDTGFDESFVVKSSSPDQLQSFLTDRRRLMLARLLESFPTVKVGDHYIRVDVRRVERDVGAFVSTARRLVGAAKTLSGTSKDLDKAFTARAVGDLGEAARRMRTAIESEPDDMERRLMEIETLAAADNVEGVRSRLTEVEELAPTDPFVAGWKQTFAEPAGPAPTQPLSESVPVDGPTIDAATATQDLFGGRQLSFAVRDKFVSRYQGSRIHWSGQVKSARAYDVDHDFGTGPGVKAVVAVASLEHDLFGSTEVDAIVEFAASTTVPERGDRLTFSGTLTAVDPLMRNFTIRDAVLD